VALISVGIDHEHASLDLLERASIPEHEWNKVLRTLMSQRNVHEAVFVSTCLRTEVVAVIDRFHGAIEEITHTLADATDLAPSAFVDHLTVNFDRDVATHLFSVASGLKSVVPGEFEVLGQLRRALEHHPVKGVALAGGVAANSTLRAGVTALAGEFGLEAHLPTLAMCTDNAAMIAAAGTYRLVHDGASSYELSARPNWQLADVS